MENENDDPQSLCQDSNKFRNQLSQEDSDTVFGVIEKNGGNATDRVRLRPFTSQNKSESETEDTDILFRTATGEHNDHKGTLNDLVADLYLSGMANGTIRASQQSVGDSNGNGLTHASYGDCKNIRATIGQGGVLNNAQSSGSINPPVPTHTQNTFSFKHFLSSGATSQAPSSTVTSLDVPINCAAVPPVTLTNTTVTTSLQSSTGARPKVPQFSSFSASVISTTHNPSSNVSCESTASYTKMKRSPRFSSFDSQASLIGVAVNSEENSAPGSSTNSSGGFRLNPFASKSSDSGVTISSHYNNKPFVGCSYSPHDLQLPAVTSHCRLETIEARPNRLSLAPSKNRVRLEAHCFPGELPVDTGPTRALSAEFLAAAAAAALPDFVQDHWMDSWYASEMHLNSPPNSPVCDFMQDLPRERRGAGGNEDNGDSIGNCCGGGNCGDMRRMPFVPTSDVAVTLSSVPSLDVANALHVNETDTPAQRLPDFLSDGPIVHSSQRLADVAAGLPSNLVNSPDDIALKQQLNSLRIENDRQSRELSETRTALTEQTRRANELDFQLLELQRKYVENDNSSDMRTETHTGEHCEQAKRWEGLTQAHVRKLKQQVKQLTAEVNALRRENESLRGEGAVGGCISATISTSTATIGTNINCDCQCNSKTTAETTGANSTNSAGGYTVGNAINPSRSQQISRDLLRAAANAENNLRQLLSGVDNLRRMASDIEQTDLRPEYDISPDLFSDFPDECDDYEEYSGGPAL